MAKGRSRTRKTDDELGDAATLQGSEDRRKSLSAAPARARSRRPASSDRSSNGSHSGEAPLRGTAGDRRWPSGAAIRRDLPPSRRVSCGLDVCDAPQQATNLAQSAAQVSHLNVLQRVRAYDEVERAAKAQFTKTAERSVANVRGVNTVRSICLCVAFLVSHCKRWEILGKLLLRRMLFPAKVWYASHHNRTK